MPLYHGVPSLMPLYQSSQNKGRWAFTVRPDLWPPGDRVIGGGSENLARRSRSVDLAERELARALSSGYGDPGVGEALILAGVWSDQGPAGMTWVEMT